jgi:hypothetical protein
MNPAKREEFLFNSKKQISVLNYKVLKRRDL